MEALQVRFIILLFEFFGFWIFNNLSPSCIGYYGKYSPGCYIFETSIMLVTMPYQDTTVLCWCNLTDIAYFTWISHLSREAGSFNNRGLKYLYGAWVWTWDDIEDVIAARLVMAIVPRSTWVEVYCAELLHGSILKWGNPNFCGCFDESTDENRLLLAHRGGTLTSEMKPSKSNKIQIKSKSIQCKDGNYCVVLEVFSMCNIPPLWWNGNLAKYVFITSVKNSKLFHH